jgi:hypothetical protein
MFSFLQGNPKVSASALGIFRIGFFTVQFFEVLQLFNFRQLVFDTTAFLEPDSVSHFYVLFAQLIALLFIIFGYKTRYAMVANFAINLSYFSVTKDFEYHMDYVYTGVNLLCFFLPVALSYSIDALMSGRKEVPKVSVVNHLVIIFATTALVYADSMFHKVTSYMWMNGLGMWLPASLPSFSWINNQWILNQEFFVKFAGYLTLVFECTFIFLIWFRKFRPFLAFIGICLHFGIFLAFPIPLFGFAYCAIYFLILLPEPFYDKFDGYFLALRKILNIKTKENIEQKTWTGFPDKVLFGIIITMGILQLNGVMVSPSAQKVLPPELVNTAWKIQHDILRPFTGIVRHGVFMDWHFKQAQYITIIKYDKETLPIWKEDGTADKYPYGRFWVNSNFRFLSVQYPKYLEGLRRYTAYWAVKNKKDLRNLHLEVFLKKYDVPKKWEYNYLTKMKNRPLQKIGDIYWKNNKFEFVKLEANSNA